MSSRANHFRGREPLLTLLSIVHLRIADKRRSPRPPATLLRISQSGNNFRGGSIFSRRYSVEVALISRPRTARAPVPPVTCRNLAAANTNFGLHNGCTIASQTQACCPKTRRLTRPQTIDSERQAMESEDC